MHVKAACSLLLVCASLSGCVSDQADDDREDSLALEDFEACDYEFSSDMYVACEDTGPTLSFHEGPAPPGWLCRFEATPVGELTHTFRIMWDPVVERMAVQFIPGENLAAWEVPLVMGFTIRVGDEMLISHWNAPTDEGYVVLPEEMKPEDGPVGEFCFGISIQAMVWKNATSPLDTGETFVIWSDSDPYAQPTLIVDTQDDGYHFPLWVNEVEEGYPLIDGIPSFDAHDFSADLFLPMLASTYDQYVGTAGSLCA